MKEIVHEQQTHWHCNSNFGPKYHQILNSTDTIIEASKLLYQVINNNTKQNMEQFMGSCVDETCLHAALNINSILTNDIDPEEGCYMFE